MKTAQIPHYHHNTMEQISQIIKRGKAALKRKADPLFEEFVTQFYFHAPSEYLSESDPIQLYNEANSLWQWAFERTSTKNRKLRVFNPSAEENGWVSDRTIIELTTKDSPFLFDSLTAEITRLGFRIYEVMHPVLRLERDREGRITKLHDRTTIAKDVAGSHLESAMQFQITHLADDKIRSQLEASLENVLQHVELAVRDWKAMQSKAIEIKDALIKQTTPFAKAEVEEVVAFMDWVISNNFIFLGYREYDFKERNGKLEVHSIPEQELGIFKAKNSVNVPLGLAALPERSLEELKNVELIEITKSNRRSLIHRPVHMDYIGIKKFNAKGQVIGECRLLGLFTSSVYYQSARLIPILRKKIDGIITQAGFEEKSHNGKALITILEGYPRDEMLQISEEDLFRICMGIVELSERPNIKLLVREDRFKRFISCITFVPKERFSTQLREKIQALLELRFDGTVSDHYTQVTESNLARLHVLIKTKNNSIKPYDIDAIEEELYEIINSWMDGLRETLIRNLGEKEGERFYFTYVDGFPDTFKEHYHFGGTYRDILKIEEARKSRHMVLDLYQLEQDGAESFQLKLYHPNTPITLSEILPFIENMGFHAIDELSFLIEPKNMEPMWVHHFRLKLTHLPQVNQDNFLPQIKQEFEDAMTKIWRGELGNDALNKLILRALMRWRDVMCLRAYSKYIRQIGFAYSHDFMAEALSNHPAISRKLVELFYARFSPSTEKKEQVVVESIEQALANVTSVTEDKIIRQFMETILSSLRTNFFQKDKDGQDKNYISFKIDAKRAPGLPLPRPFVEVFVFSPDVEGIHLRGGKVARGGLRWSDRREDFRTEVLGLMKAQMVKNTVIVPVGSKGGFVVKRPIKGDRDAMLKQGISCYRTFLSGILDITDNIVKGKMVAPVDVKRHDADDPYLVVAADKGTATFSDIANDVSAAYGFWLGDAFASGGSVGYDHKAMGITAKGAWVSVKRHFMEMGVDIDKQEFTVVGIGDMSGDVFGNGMLLSPCIRLVAAFNHMHIFIDPNPDAAKSFVERKRLFELPRSNWTDYNTKLISAGGGVFDRQAKIIPLSKQIKERFGINADQLSPDELIKTLLRSEVDLLWNGGIGTYVKAEAESHEEVGDKANDVLRINGNELAAKVVGEGGNLGFTQRGRIEYALKGGRINTDAIDNSAGVDTSDHEVNIKIALQAAMERGALTLKDRNKLLESMTDEVASLVLKDNFQQTQVLSISERRAKTLLDDYIRMMHRLEKIDLLKRKIEFLPSDDALLLRNSSNQPLTRPELAVLLSYSKIDIFNDLAASNLPDEAYLEKELFHYFPAAMRVKYKQDILGHRLRRDIIATQVCNDIVNRMGSTFYYNVMGDTGVKGCDIARGYMISRDLFGLSDLFSEIEQLGANVTVETRVALFLEVQKLIDRTTRWLFRHAPHPLKISEMLAYYGEGIETLSKAMNAVISPLLKASVDVKFNHFVAAGVPQGLARKIADLEPMASAPSIVHVAKTGELPIRTVGEIYFALGMRLGLGSLRTAAERLSGESYWQRLAVKTTVNTLYDQQMRLTGNVINVACDDDVCTGALDAWSKQNEKALARYDSFMEEMKRHEVLDDSMLTVALQRVELLCQASQSTPEKTKKRKKV